jgi:hypothetical protein
VARYSAQAKQVLDVLNSRQSFAAAGPWLGRVLELLPAGSQLQDDTLQALVSHLRGGYGDEYVKIGADLAAHLRFWQTLAARFPDRPRLAGIFADTLLIGGRIPEALDRFLEAFEADPTLLYQFGGELYDHMKEAGGRRWLRYRLAIVRAALADHPRDDDYIRDQLDEIRREFANDSEALPEIRRVAAEAALKR